MNAAAALVDLYWHIHRSSCSKMLLYAHTTSPTLPSCGISLNSLKLPAPEARNLLESNLLCASTHWYKYFRWLCMFQFSIC